MTNSENKFENRLKIASLIAYGLFEIAIVGLCLYFFILSTLTH